MNLPTVLIGLLILGLFVAVVVKLVRDTKHGKGGCTCGGNCSHCGACGVCHNKE